MSKGCAMIDASEPITVRLPSNAMQRVRRVSQIARRLLDDVIAQRLQTALPPLPEDMPAAIQGELAALEDLPDASPRQQMRAALEPDILQGYDELLTAHAAGRMSY